MTLRWSELLPDTVDLYERTVMDAAQDTVPIPIRQIVDPAQTPVAFIPFLAVHNGVKLWFDDWSEARKRQMIADWELPDLIGTRLGLRRYLAYVDAELISAVAHPRRFVLGRSAVGVQPLQFPPFTARYLIKVKLKRHIRSVVAGRSAAGIHAAVPVDRESIRRAKIAATVAKVPGTQYTATFAHRRRATFGDGISFDAGHHFGDFVPRISL
ncbi:phage tail protein I [Bosea sp. 2KB_26]|uniref:phage tail protein I n=1 Tax=Bosea sp. 2KB_26 TaxID=3237475 RepID=UPI003F8F3D32